MKIQAVYDAGDRFIDRYTIVTDRAEMIPLRGDALELHRGYQALGVSDNPTHPQQGFSQWTAAIVGPHLGKRIEFAELPENVQEHVLERLGA